jgi:phosphate transport system substrate-binding protein
VKTAILAIWGALVLPLTVLSQQHTVSTGPVQVDQDIPQYRPSQEKLAGDYNVVGAVALKKAMEIWTTNFTSMYPGVHFRLKLTGSSTAAAPLVTGLSQVAPMGRELWDLELIQFEHTWGYLPMRIQVSRGSYDVSQRSQILAVYVNSSNPVAKLTLDQVDAIYTHSRKRGYPYEILTWGQAGCTGAWASRPIHLYSLAGDSTGVAEWFRVHALNGGRFHDTIEEIATPQELMKRIAADPGAIGFTGISYANPSVRVVPLAESSAGPFSTGSLSDVLAGHYPLTRFMYVYINRAPGKPMDPVMREFFTYVLSEQGQQAQATNGELLPLPADVARQELKQLDTFSALSPTASK